MSTRATTTFAMTSWDEKPFDEFDGGRKLTRARVAFTYHGDIEGESTLEYLMAYAPNGSGNYVCLERVVGRIGERVGSFVLQHAGTFDAAHAVKDTWFIVPGSGTGELQGLSGAGEYGISGQGPYPVTFEYDLK